MKLPRGVKRGQLLKALDRMQGRRVVVLGDFVLDEYLYGRTSRISREAPVLVVQGEHSEYRLGGAANVAHNIAVLGGTVSAVSLIGKDEAGERLVTLSRAAGIDTHGLLEVAGRATPHKTRVLAGGLHTGRQQMLRLDRGGGPKKLVRAGRKLDEAIGYTAGQARAFALSDYGLGSVTPERLARVRRLARGRPVCGDSRYALGSFRGLALLTPNEPEAEAVLGVRIEDDARARQAGEKLRARLRSDALLLKRGHRGMMLFEKGRKAQTIEAFGREEVTDVTGAGDTVLAVVTLALAARVSRIAAASLANLAGGLVVLKAGAATVSPRELASAVRRATR